MSQPLSSDFPDLVPGARVGRWRLDSFLGQGGMGIVWKATDTTLDRPVALKFLPASLARDAERLARLEREARLLAALHHPHIASIHGLESAGDVPFLVLEYVPGETLASRIAHGPLPLEEVLRIALGIATALEAAHERGIVHRDLKPQNVQVDPDGNVKLLDFGLARAFRPDESGSGFTTEESPTISARMTGADVILGTAAYMSPEQARGRPVDRRTDIWAFGVVIFEALTGLRLFAGETVSDTLASVLRLDLPWEALPPSTPPSLVSLLRRCLERDPKQRLRDIGEARIALERLLAGGDAEVLPVGDRSPTPAPARFGLRRIAPWLVAALALGGLAGWLLRTPSTDRETAGVARRFALTLASDLPVRALAISPDGGTIAYATEDRLWAHGLHQLEPRALLEVKGVQHVFWSPDSKSIGFLAGSRIERISLADGARQLVSETGRVFPEAGGAFWREDGAIVFTHSYEDGMFAVPSGGGEPRSLIEVDSTRDESDFHEPSGLPGGRGILCVVHRTGSEVNRIAVITERERKVVLEVPGATLRRPLWSPTGHILFERVDGVHSIWAVPYSLAAGKTAGEPFLVARGMTLGTVAGDGTLVALEGRSDLQFTVVDRNGAFVDTIGPPTHDFTGTFDVTPDGRRIVVALQGQDSDLWIYDADRGVRSRLTFGAPYELMPTWTPSRRRVSYQFAAKVPPASGFDWGCAVRNADGSGAADTLQTGGFTSPIYLHDESLVLFTRVGTEVFRGIAWSAATPHAPVHDIPSEPHISFYPRPSPDGRYIAYMETIGGDFSRHQVFLRRFPEGSGRWQVSPEEGLWPRWNARGDRLYYIQGEDVMEVPIELGDEPRLGTPVRLFSRRDVHVPMPFGWTPQFGVVGNGDRFVLAQPARTPGSERIVVSLGWNSAPR